MGFLEEEMARRRLHDYVSSLEDERKKMLVFHRELPLSLDLISRALESYRLQMGGGAEEETSSEGLVLKEFIPTVKSGSDVSDDEDDGGGGEGREVEEEVERSKEVPDWLRAAQLCDPPREMSENKDDVRMVEPEVKKESGALQRSLNVETAGGGGGRSRSGGEDKYGRGQKKARRCWSPELHHRFLNALQQLGGSNVATPKQIRELMKVEGLTNDEVKSHLQKYRLHTRRGSPPSQPNTSGNSPSPQPQVVFFGGMWPLPPEHSGAATSNPSNEQCGSPANRIYAPVASIPGQQNKKQKPSGCVGERSRSSNSDSSATSTSSHTVTTTESPRS